MIPPERFIARSSNRPVWLAARRTGVTATQVATAATPSGFLQAVTEFQSDEPVEMNDYMQFGVDSEDEIADWVKEEFGIFPNNWLIRGDRPTDLATPDGLSLDHTRVAEIKTTGKDWTVPPIKYRRQVQWQLHVTGAQSCVLAWNLREPDGDGWFRLGWWEPKTLLIERDEEVISQLIEAADNLMEARNGELQPR